MNEFQEQIYKTIDILVEEKLKTLKFNRSKKGKVLSVNGNYCIVEIDGEGYTCKIRKDLQVEIDDIVYVSYPENDESDKYVDIVLGDNIVISGHMLKQDYDSDEDGKVDLAEHADTATSANYANEAGTSSDSNTVNGHTVESDVPANAKFTDTIYSHPSTHPYSMITGTPTSLPADGGNADTVDGKHASDFANTSHTHPYASEGGTTFTGTYPMVARIGANNYYSHPGIQFIGETSTLEVSGMIKPGNNTSYTTGQARKIILSTGDPSGGGNGDVWIKYT